MSIISYADRRWSVGNLYEKIGFDFIKNTNPNYWYIKNGERKYRFKFRKSELIKEGYNSDKTEKLIMNERGYIRIWDCGHRKYKLNLVN